MLLSFKVKISPLSCEKEHIEYVVRLSKGTYGIVNLVISGSQQVSLFYSWGNYFDLMNHHQDTNKLFKMLEKQCSTVTDLFTANSIMKS